MQASACPKRQVVKCCLGPYILAVRSRTETNGHADPAPLVAIVDDDESVRQSTLRLIRSFGYRAHAFATGAEFLASPATSEAACVVLDVRMPHMDGLEVQRRLAETGTRIPIVFLTGRATDDEEGRARSGGAMAFLRKPVGPAALLEVLQEVMKT
jgi:two-component system, LuxR family, response regulator FixJ